MAQEITRARLNGSSPLLSSLHGRGERQRVDVLEVADQLYGWRFDRAKPFDWRQPLYERQIGEPHVSVV